MKKLFLTLCVLLFNGSVLKANDDFRVHEWGTFTTFHGPNGGSLEWYQLGNRDPINRLPGFVQQGIGSKLGNFRTRMETPVIYFYTAVPREVRVTASMTEGHITELYPGLKGIKPLGTIPPFSAPWFEIEWKINLIPPERDRAKEITLPVDPELPDNHYFEARNVPEAAYVENITNDEELQHEKFIFYRGAGREFMNAPILLDESGGFATVENSPLEIWLIQNRNDRLNWTKLNRDNPKDLVEDRLGSILDGEPSVTVEDELVSSLHLALVTQGLSESEASAMINTWKSHWFDEPGLRTLTIVPREVVDAMVPLEITPSPSQLERVFVHRAEMMTHESFSALEQAMSPDLSPQEARKFIDQQYLGRFVVPAMGEVARSIGVRVAEEHRMRGMRAIEE